ncbi:hypothetical protein [Streptomyces griseomycini]|uniref:hypothetical protein n=1 Tax=Streptomyces griseomycini TaxID=66895 RepID=UPI001874693F|nr:hypothetical protein [Streptomyces griseomycini]
MLIEGNAVDDATWDAVGAMNTTDIIVRGNTINNSADGVHVSPMSARTVSRPPVQVGPNPVSGAGITDNQVTVAAGASGASRSADTVGSVSPVSDVVVTGNRVSGGGFHCTPHVTFRPGTAPQR